MEYFRFLESIYPVRTWPPDEIYFPQCTFVESSLFMLFDSLAQYPLRKEGTTIGFVVWKGPYGWLQRIQEREQLLLLLFSELSEAPGHVLCLASVPFNGIF